MKRILKKRDAPPVCHKYCLLVQDKWARQMTGLTQGLTKKKLICFLLVFIVLSAGFFLYNIYAVFSKNNAELLKNTFSITKKYNK